MDKNMNMLIYVLLIGIIIALCVWVYKKYIEDQDKENEKFQGNKDITKGRYVLIVIFSLFLYFLFGVWAFRVSNSYEDFQSYIKNKKIKNFLIF